MTAGPQVVLSATEGRPRVAATETPGVQDLVVTHLYTPWPLTDTGQVTYAWTELDETSLRLGFRPRDSADRIELLPFRVPGDPPRVVVAG